MSNIVDQLIGEVLAGIAGDVENEGVFSEARHKAREGDPMPLARLHWPNSKWDTFQEELLRNIFNPQIWACVTKGSTGCGKGATVGRAICLYYDVWPDAKIIMTSVTHEHCLSTLFNEVKVWMNRMMIRPKGLIGAMSIKDNESHFILPVNPANETAFAGKHSQGGHTMFVFDEACHDDQTEVLTRDGWKFFKDLTGEEEFLSMDIHTEQVEWLKATHVHVGDHDGPMHLLETRGTNFCVTPNHRMIYEGVNGKRTLKEIQNFPKVMRHPVKQTILWENPDQETYTLPELKGQRKDWPATTFRMDDWLELVAWYLSEGHLCFVNGVAYSARFTQQFGETFDRMTSLFQRMGLDFSVAEKATTPQIAIHSRQLAEHLLEIAGHGSLVKRVPEFVGDCSARQIKLFLEVYRDGDGYARKTQDIIYTSSKALADGLHILALKTNRRSTLTKRALKGQVNDLGTHTATSTCDGYVLAISNKDRRVRICQDRTQQIHYTGKVYCVTLPKNETLLTRRKGKVIWSGNSGVDPDRWDNMGDQANVFIGISNPRSPKCRFRSMFPSVDPDKTQVITSPRGNIFCQTVSAVDMMNYRKQCLSKPIGPLGGITIDGKRFEHGERIPHDYYKKHLPIIPGQHCYDQVQADMAGKDKRRIEWQVHAKFPSSDDEVQVILPDWLDRHQKAWTDINDIPPLIFGLDVAASTDGDCSCLVVGSERGVKGIHVTQKADTTETVGWVYTIAREVYGVDLKRQGHVIGDAIGVGKGPLDTLAAEGVEVLHVYAGGRPLIDSDRFGNVRAEMYGLLGDRLNPDGEHKTPFPIPPDEKLAEELVAPEKIYDHKGKFKLTPKTESKIDQGSGRKVESIKDKIGRSPDRADAVALMYLGVKFLEVEGPAVVNRPLLIASPEEMAGQAEIAKRRKPPTVYDPNLPPWLNPCGFELAGLGDLNQPERYPHGFQTRPHGFEIR